jgi:hypothetical protein
MHVLSDIAIGTSLALAPYLSVAVNGLELTNGMTSELSSSVGVAPSGEPFGFGSESGGCSGQPNDSLVQA